jgi:glutamate-1-semialdehyde 2,1-aminomutase
MTSIASASGIDRDRLTHLLGAEREQYRAEHPRSRELFADGRHLFGRVPMTWMGKAAGGFPVYLDRARGARVSDVDGHEYVDFCLGDTGAMAGHSPPATVAAVADRYAELGGATAMLPTEDAEWVAAELTRRFGLTRWSFTLTATDANRWALRLARAVTGRPKVLVNSFCYHGSVDESLIVRTDDGRVISRPGNVGAPCDVTLTSRVVEFNDLDALERELSHRDVAAVLMEPALTNIGIVLPEPGYLDGVRALTREVRTLLINDETHTLSAGPGGATRAWGLEPDILTIGKAIGGGIPCGAYGMSEELTERIETMTDLDLVDVGGIGGTLAGNALSLAAMRATLGSVLTAETFEAMFARAARWHAQVAACIEERSLPWSVSRLGARAEYRFASPAPRHGGASAAAHDEDLEDYLHVYLANRGILMTPFHNMALMCPDTADADIDLHGQVFAQALDQLLA